ncbi:MAG: hypothetical protein HY819_04300 [Acidobacteria bacterium]|nr:hypothetical protein [Acidobacteriota bacterium]
MKFLYEQVLMEDAIFVNLSDKEIGFYQNQLDFLSNCYKRLREAQDILEKLGEITIIGYTYTEEKLVESLEKLKELIIDKSSEELKNQLLVVRKNLWEYLVWIKENTNNLSAQLLRQDIEHSLLTYEDLLALAYLLSLTKPTSKEDISKFELILAELCNRIAPNQLNNLLDYIVAIEELPLSTDTQKILLEISELTIKISTTESFYQFILNDYLSKARMLKQSLSTDFWHKEVVLAVAKLDLELKKQFQKLSSEKAEILEICTKILGHRYNTVAGLEDGSSLNLSKAKVFIEDLDKVLAEDYEKHNKELKQTAKIFEVLYQANEELEEIDHQKNQTTNQPSKVKNSQQFVASKVAESRIDTLIETYSNVGVTEIEQQLDLRTQEITDLLKKSPSNTLNLKYSKLALSQTEINALLSQGQVLDNTLQVQQNALVRRIVTLVAELQETFTFLSQKNKSTFLTNGKRNIVNSLCEEIQKTISDVDFMILQAQNLNDINLSISLISVKNKLGKISEQASQWMEKIFPQENSSVSNNYSYQPQASDYILA